MKFKNIFGIFIINLVSILFSFVSCKSSEQNNFAESIKTDYSQEDVRNAEIKRIKDLFLNNPIEALWRSVLLGDEQLIKDVSVRAKDYCLASLEQKDYLQLYFVFYFSSDLEDFYLTRRQLVFFVFRLKLLV